jgi:fructose-1-phosphate kinase PfkB-like protein
MVKPNRSELGSTFGFAVDTDAHLKQAIRQLVELGTKCALITMGAKGAIFCDGRDFWSIPAPSIHAVNPIGSGDSVAAGYVGGMLEGLAPLEAAVLGIACGAANALTPIPGVLTLADVQRLRADIRPQPWDGAKG